MNLGNIHSAAQISAAARCHGFTGTDSFGYVGKAGWHGLGESVEPGTTVREGVRRFLPWRVVLTDGVSGTINGERRIVSDAYRLLVREDTGDVFACVSQRYSPAQNEELADLLDSVVSESGGTVKLETVGSIQGGRRVFVLADGGAFGLNGDRDVVAQYMLAAASHDGTAAVNLGPTSIRVVCKNTLNAATVGMGGQFSFRHTGDVAAKLRQVRAAFSAWKSGADKFRAAAVKLDARPISRDEIQRLWTEVYIDAERDGKPLPDGLTREEREEREDAAATLRIWARNFDQEVSAGVASASAWTAVNAVTRWYDHQRTVRGADDRARKDARVFSALWGLGNDRKAVAFKAGLSLVS